MTPLTDTERNYLLERLLQRTLPWLLRQQLPTGEFAAYRQVADHRLPYVFPLLSAFALDALDCLDPNSDHFHERLFDLIAASDRARVRIAVSTLRWRLRMHLAASQEPDGTWRRFGRSGDSPRCHATTVFALLMYLGQTLRPQRDSAAILSHLRDKTPQDALGEIFAQRVLSLCGQSSAAFSPQTLSSIERSPEPMLPLWAAAQACHEGALTCDDVQRGTMLRLTLAHGNAEVSFRTRHERAFGITVLNFCHDGSPVVQQAIDRAITELLLEPEPPSRWSHDPLLFGVSSAPVTLLLGLRALAQAVLFPRAVECAPC